MNKEDRYSHLIPLDKIMCHFSPYCCHTTQTVVIKAGKSDCLCWNGSTTIKPNIVMNQVTRITREAPITVGHFKMQSILTFTIHISLTHIHNTSGHGRCKGMLLYPLHTRRLKWRF
jgi:hypothetical protein